MNELNSLRAYVKVVEAGSFAAAARQLGASKSVITKRINQLEAHLQIELIQRSTRRLNITDTGSAFYERCVRILAELDEAKTEVSSVELGLSGSFRVSCISSFTAAYLAQDMCEFALEHPNLSIDVRQHDRVCDPVQEGFDVSIQPTALSSGIVDEFEVVPVRRAIVATQRYIDENGMPQSPQDLVRYRFAHNNHVQPSHTLDFYDGTREVRAKIRPVLLTNTVWQLRAAVLHGNCAALMPLFFVERELCSGELVPILAHCRVRSVTLSAYFRRTPFVPMKIRLLKNFLQRRYGDFPPWEKRLVDARPELATLVGPRRD